MGRQSPALTTLLLFPVLSGWIARNFKFPDPLTPLPVPKLSPQPPTLNLSPSKGVPISEEPRGDP